MKSDAGRCRSLSALIGMPVWSVRWRKAKKQVFSVVKAVKENARDRVGPVPAERVIPDPKQKAAAKPKHKKTLADLLSVAREEKKDEMVWDWLQRLLCFAGMNVCLRRCRARGSR